MSKTEDYGGRHDVRGGNGALTRVVLDPHRAVGTLDRNIYGGFIEHLGRCIYGGIYEEGSSLSNADGFRTDVLGLLRDLRLSVLRWPGGNFASNYHWDDGIGPKDRRPRTIDLAWQTEEPNHFGTDEFLRYCRALGTEAYICLNMGTGDLQEALAWVEYCNHSGCTKWAGRRRQNGRDAPYGVRYWGLGNEMNEKHQIGARSAREYVLEAARWARAIRKLDPSVKLVSCGKNGWSNWDRRVIEAMASVVDLHSVHMYTGSENYWTNVLQPHQIERSIRGARAFIERAAYAQKLRKAPRIAVDEWNVWRTDAEGHEVRYNFSDALAVATYLNIFVRNCNWVGLANMAQMVNVLAPIVTTTTHVAAQPIYYPFLMHSRSALDVVVDVHVESPKVDAPEPEAAPRWPDRLNDLGPFDLVDVCATTDKDRRRVSVILVNRSFETAEDVQVLLRDLDFHGDACIRTATAGAGAGNRAIPSVQPTRVDEHFKGGTTSGLWLSLPPQSFTSVEVGMHGQ